MLRRALGSAGRGLRPARRPLFVMRRYCSAEVERDEMEYDVVVVGGGPSGLATAIRLKQLAAADGDRELNVCLVEKGSEIGAHILSGACIETRALDELLPDWKEKGAPVTTKVTRDEFVLLTKDKAFSVPEPLIPGALHNHGNYIISLGALCAWMGEQAEEMGIDVFPGFAAADAIYENGKVVGIVTDDKGISKKGEQKDTFQPGMLLKAKQTVFAEGCRGSVTKKLFKEYNLRADCQPQTYGLGIKEVWEIDPSKHEQGLVRHTIGWPTTKAEGHDNTYGGSWMYHMEDNMVSIGFVVGLDYKNSYIRPYMEMQKWKTHPEVSKFLEGGKCVSYGARTLSEGGLLSLPKLTFPGGVLVGDTAGFLNLPKIKGTHAAMKSGILAAEATYEDLFSGGRDVEYGEEVKTYRSRFESSWLHQELHKVRNVRQVFAKNFWAGVAYTGMTEMVTKGKEPLNMKHQHEDHNTHLPIEQCKPIEYPKPDGKLTFDLLFNHSRSQTAHEGDQPAHLKPRVWELAKKVDYDVFGGTLAKFCPAGVYDYQEQPDGKIDLTISAQNCLHCKACDIKCGNIDWTVPEGGGGPNYDKAM